MTSLSCRSRVISHVLGFGTAIGYCSSLYGKGFSPTLDLSILTNSFEKSGAVIGSGKTENDLGVSVSNAGDVNGDGWDDVIVGANLGDPNGKGDAGESYVIFGRKGGIDSNLEVSSLNGKNGFKLDGIKAGDRSGVSVSGAGDVNGDGLDDLIIGAYFADPNGKGNAGESYVVFGRREGFEAVVELSGLNGSNGFRLNGFQAVDNAGFSVSKAGDINGDGFDDVVVGAAKANPNGKDNAGVSYVVFGKDGGFGSTLELGNLNGVNGFRLNGTTVGDFSGRSVSGVGDVNGDGIDDLVLGAPYSDFNGKKNVGGSYVVFGKKTSFAATIELNAFNGSNGFKLVGVDGYDFSGRSVSGAGDVNGDGLNDLIIGASGEFPAGESYIIFGSRKGFPAVFELISLNGSNGFKLSGINAGDESGFSVSGAGDINGDGIDDLVVGARYADPNGKNAAGQSYIVFGERSGMDSKLELGGLNGKNGFKLNGINADDNSGVAVNRAGDVNGDGVGDVIIGASGAGKSYLIYGQDISPEGDFTGNRAPDLLLQYPNKTLRILPLKIESNAVVSAELPGNADFPLPASVKMRNIVSQKNHVMPQPDEDNDDVPTQKPDISNPFVPSKPASHFSSRFSSLDFDGKGVSDILIREKNQLKLFLLDNDGLPLTPRILSEINFTVPKKYRYVGAGSLTGKRDNKLDLILKKGRSLFVAENLGTSFSTELKPLVGNLPGKVFSVQRERIVTVKGRKLSQQGVNELTLGVKTQLGSLAKGQTPLLMLDINQDGKLDIVTLDKKKSVGFVSEDNLSSEPISIVPLPKKARLVGPR